MGHRRGHSWEVRGAPRSSDDNLKASRCCLCGVAYEKFRSSMRRYDLRLIRNAELLKDLRGYREGLPIRLGTHNETNEGRGGFRHGKRLRSLAGYVNEVGLVTVVEALENQP